MTYGEATFGEAGFGGSQQSTSATTDTINQVIASEVAQPIDVDIVVLPQNLALSGAAETSEAAVLTPSQTGPAATNIGLQQVVESDATFNIDPPTLNREITLGVATESDGVRSSGVKKLTPTYGDIVRQDSPIAYYPMDELAGATSADVINGHTGNWSGTYQLNQSRVVPSSAGTAVRVANGGLLIQPYEAWQNSPSYSAEVWFQPEAGSFNYGMILNRYNSVSGSAWYVALRSDGSIEMTNFTNTGGAFTTTTAANIVQVGQKYHFVRTWTKVGSLWEARLFVNGVQVLFDNNMSDALYAPNTAPLAVLGFGTDYSGTYACAGTLDEAAFYDYALPLARVKAHYDYGLLTLPNPLDGVNESDEAQSILADRAQPIYGRLVIERAYESDSISVTGIHGPDQYVRFQAAVETDRVENINTEYPWAGASAQPATTWNTPLPLQERGLSGAAESDQARQLTALFDQAFTLGQAVETEAVSSFPHHLIIPVETVVEIEETTGFTLRATLKHGATGTLSLLTEDILLDPVYALTILDDKLRRAPTSLTWMMSGVPLDTTVTVYFDSETVAAGTAESNSEGMIGPVAINVTSNLLAGSHTLRAEVGGVQVAVAPFTLELDPALYPGTVGADAQALEIPGVVSHDTRHWVFQDLLAESEGGIGSFILPINPREMSSPHQEYGMTARHTTAITGQFHIFQTGATPKEWTFSGYCPDQATQEQMLAYRNLNRRFYIIDHRNRAWKVVVTNMEFTPRLRHIFNDVETDWGSDYTVTATILDQDWVHPA